MGFGISSPEQVERISHYADAVIVGSAIVRIIEKHGADKEKLFDELSSFISGLSRACGGPESETLTKANI